MQEPWTHLSFRSVVKIINKFRNNFTCQLLLKYSVVLNIRKTLVEKLILSQALREQTSVNFAIAQKGVENPVKHER